MNDEAPISAAGHPEANAAGKAASPDDDYQILQPIGRGAYGEVYLTRDKQGAYRALKVIFRESFDHDRPFERECEGICKFEAVSRSHPNQIQIFKSGRRNEPERFYYIMELADDRERGQDIEPETYAPRTLRSDLIRRGALPTAECIRLGLTLAGAMETLHENGLIHRDIKPANIIFVKNQPRLADIGLVTDAEMSVSHVGTEGFIAPEGPGSVRADIYSFGKVLYEMCTGRDRMDFPELPANLSELPDRQDLLELNAVIAKACAPDARRRYRNTGELINDLRYVQGGHSLRRRRARRRRLAAAAITAGVGAILGLLSFGAVKIRQALTARPPPPPNLVQNGSFEWPIGPFHGKGLAPEILSAAYLEPWQTTAGTFEIWRDGFVMPDKYTFRSADGFQNLEILSTTNRATVWQTVPTIPGMRYVFSFYHTPRPRAVSRLTVSVGDRVVGTFDEDGIELTNFVWKKFTTNVVAAGRFTTLSFADSARGAAGTHLDGVVLARAQDEARRK